MCKKLNGSALKSLKSKLSEPKLEKKIVQPELMPKFYILFGFKNLKLKCFIHVNRTLKSGVEGGGRTPSHINIISF